MLFRVVVFMTAMAVNIIEALNCSTLPLPISLQLPQRKVIKVNCIHSLFLLHSHLIADTAWFGADQTGPEGSRIDWRCMWGLLLEATLLPATFCFGGAFALAVFKYPTVSSKVIDDSPWICRSF
jgi:hypothetical protein